MNTMNNVQDLKLYEGIYWERDNPDFIGVRFEIWAKNLTEASNLFEKEFGKDKIYSLHNEEDANMPRNF